MKNDISHPKYDIYSTPLSTTADMVATAASVLNDSCQQLPFNLDTLNTSTK